jgi:hypothetical protein
LRVDVSKHSRVFPPARHPRGRASGVSAGTPHPAGGDHQPMPRGIHSAQNTRTADRERGRPGIGTVRSFRRFWGPLGQIRSKKGGTTPPEGTINVGNRGHGCPCAWPCRRDCR